jgi:hypothetical protein
MDSRWRLRTIEERRVGADLRLLLRPDSGGEADTHQPPPPAV